VGCPDIYIEKNNGLITLSCENVPMQTLLQTLSEAEGFNLLVAHPLDMPVSISVKNLVPEKLLEVLLVSYHVNYTFVDDLLVVSKHQADIASTQLVTFPLKYAKAKEVSDILSKQISVSFDERTNSLIVKDAQQNVS